MRAPSLTSMPSVWPRSSMSCTAYTKGRFVRSVMCLCGQSACSAGAMVWSSFCLNVSLAMRALSKWTGRRAHGMLLAEHLGCPLLAQSRHELLRCKCPLLTQSGHCAKTYSALHVSGRRQSTRRPKAQLSPRRTTQVDPLRSQNGGLFVLSWVAPTRRTYQILSLHYDGAISHFCNSRRDGIRF